MPALRACGSRENTFAEFVAAANSERVDYIAMFIDSEDPITDIERTWGHLCQRDGWSRPVGAADDQVLFMTTCMETWIAADRDALRNRFARDFNENPLPPLIDLESRHRHNVFEGLKRATNGRYSKGAISFELLGRLDPKVLEQQLPSFKRARRILDRKLS